MARGHATTNTLLVTHTVNQSQELTGQFRRFINRVPDNDTIQQALETIQALLEQAMNDPSRPQLTEAEKRVLLSARSQIETHDTSYWNAFKDMMLNLSVSASGGVMGNVATEIVKLVVYGTFGPPLT